MSPDGRRCRADPCKAWLQAHLIEPFLPNHEPRNAGVNAGLAEAWAEAREAIQRVPFFVHVSDVDELLDPRLVAKQQPAWPNCLPAQ